MKYLTIDKFTVLFFNLYHTLSLFNRHKLIFFFENRLTFYINP